MHWGVSCAASEWTLATSWGPSQAVLTLVSVASAASGNAARRPRTQFNTEQLGLLNAAFQITPCPDWDTLESLAKELNRDTTVVKVGVMGKGGDTQSSRRLKHLQCLPGLGALGSCTPHWGPGQQSPPQRSPGSGAEPCQVPLWVVCP